MSDQVTPRLPVLRTALDSFRVSLRNITAFARIVWPWLIALVLINGALYWLLYEREQAALASGGWGSSLLFFATAVVSTIIGALVAVPWHRTLLLGEKPEHGLRNLTTRHWLYAAYAVALFAVLPVPFVLADLVPGESAEWSATTMLVTGVAFLALWILINRLSLVLPAVALDAPDANLRGAWNMTRGNTARLLLSNTLILVLWLLPPFVALIVAVSSSPDGGEGVAAAPTPTRLAFTLESVAWELVFLVYGLIFVTFLSLAYRHLSGLPRPADQSAAKQ